MENSLDTTFTMEMSMRPRNMNENRELLILKLLALNSMDSSQIWTQWTRCIGCILFPKRMKSMVLSKLLEINVFSHSNVIIDQYRKFENQFQAIPLYPIHYFSANK